MMDVSCQTSSRAHKTYNTVLLLICEKSGGGRGMHDTQADRAQYSDWLLLKNLGFLKTAIGLSTSGIYLYRIRLSVFQDISYSLRLFLLKKSQFDQP